MAGGQAQVTRDNVSSGHGAGSGNGNGANANASGGNTNSNPNPNVGGGSANGNGNGNGGNNNHVAYRGYPMSTVPFTRAPPTPQQWAFDSTNDGLVYVPTGRNGDQSSYNGGLGAMGTTTTGGSFSSTGALQARHRDEVRNALF